MAITGDENVNTTLIVTEGFGEIAMANRTFELLSKCEGKIASISGRTQIRAGVMRPEVIIPVDKDPDEIKYQSKEEKGVQSGDPVE